MSRIFELYGEKFITNLDWSIVKKKDVSSFLKEKKGKGFCFKLCRKDLCNLGIIEGLSESEAKSYPLLAPTIAGAVEQVPFAGIFQIDDSLAYCIAVNENRLILPGGEKLGNTEEVKETYLSNLELLGNWKKLVSNGTAEDLYNIFLNSEKRYYYRKFPVNKLAAGIVVVSLLTVAGMLGWNYYKQWKYRKELQLTKQHLNPSVIKHIVEKTGEKAVPKQGIEAYPPELIRYCLSEYGNLNQKLLGWKVDTLECGDRIHAALTRIPSIPVAYVSENMTVHGLESAELTEDNAVHSVQVQPLNDSKTENALRRWSFLWNTEVEVENSSESPKAVEKFRIQGENLLSLLSLEEVPNIAVKDITIAYPDWTVEGYIGKFPKGSRK